MSVAADLTDEEVEEIDRRLRERRMRQTTIPAQPSLPQPGSFDHAKMVADERKLAERRADARAREEDEARERAAEEERRRVEWERNAPVRAAAREEFERLERELTEMDAEREKLLEREQELESVMAQ
jgi:hypothetical protein